MKKVIISTDPYDSESPRDWDNLGMMYCEHQRYALGDKDAEDPRDPDGPDGLRPEIALALPLYLYDHSGISISVRSFNGRAQHAEWDSGMVGMIYVTRARLLEEYGGTRVTKAKLEKAEKVLRGEVEVYDQYLRGDVYAFRVVEFDEVADPDAHYAEFVDSCGGFYGSNIETNGMLDHIAPELHTAAREAMRNPEYE